MKSKELVMVFTGKDLGTMTEEGGSGHWLAKDYRVKNAEYLVCVRNRRETWAAKDHEHGTAFLVGRISGSTVSPYDNRIVITLSEYALIDVPEAWSKCTNGQRYPVAYLDEQYIQKQLGKNFAELEWLPFPTKDSKRIDKNKTASLTIAQAKEGLAKNFGVSTDRIEITIKG